MPRAKTKTKPKLTQHLEKVAVKDMMLETSAFTADIIANTIAQFHNEGYRTPVLQHNNKKLSREEAAELTEVLQTAVKDAVFKIMASRGL